MGTSYLHLAGYFTIVGLLLFYQMFMIYRYVHLVEIQFYSPINISLLEIHSWSIMCNGNLHTKVLSSGSSA